MDKLYSFLGERYMVAMGNKDVKTRSFIHKAVLLVWCIFILYMFVRLHEDMKVAFAINIRHIRLVEFIIVIAIALECILFRAFFNEWSDRRKGIVIFFIALAVRLISLSFLEYTPTNDFAKYFNGACHFAENGFKQGVYSELLSYGIPSFAGQAIINGLLLHILSPTLLGMQVLNSIYTAGICLLIYLLGKEIEPKGAIVGAVFYTFYPLSILSTQMTTNHHGATFFMLLGINLFSVGLKNEEIKNRVFIFCSCAISLVVSNYYHPSNILTMCAFGIYMLIYEIEVCVKSPQNFICQLMDEIKQYRGIFISTVTVLVLYVFFWKGTLLMITESGYYTSSSNFSVIDKFVVGLNFESGGGYNGDDYDLMASLPAEQRNAAGIKLIKERLSEHSLAEIVEFMIGKTEWAWYGIDNYFWFYNSWKQYEVNEDMNSITDPIYKREYEEQWINHSSWVADIGAANTVFVYCMWGLALIGIISILWKCQNDNIIYWLLYIPLGWMLFVMISEAQSRYRYQSMAIIVLLGGFGLQTIRNKWKSFRTKKCGGKMKDA